MGFRSSSRQFSAAVALCVLAAIGGCRTWEKVAPMAGLSDVVPTGPQGRACYEKCANHEVGCKHMCPKVHGACHEDCMIDTRFCLVECPEIERVTPVPVN